MKKAFTPTFRISEINVFQKLSSCKLLLVSAFLLLYFSGFKTLAQTCKVTDFLYLNDPQDYQTQGFVHKLKIGSGGTLTEVPNGLGNTPWFPQGGGLGSPHGLGQDLNGNLYIGANSDTGPIAKITCDGTLVNLNFINDAGFNIVSKDGYLFVNSSSSNRISRYALCDGSAQGYVTLNGSTQLDWGLFISPNGTFYATTGVDPAFASATGKKAIYRFTPTDADFTNHTDYQPLVSSNDLPPGAAAKNLSIPAGGAWLWGITADNAGNMYVIAEDPWFNHQGTTWTGFTWILKYDPNGNLVAWTKDEQTTTPKVGFKGGRGILYYPAADVLYVAAGQNGDCVSMIKPSDLSYIGAAAGNVPNQNPKTLRIASEACPVSASTVVDTTLCNLKVGDKLFLSQLIGKCSAPICGGTWAADAANVGMTFNQCDLSFTVNNLSGCGKFTLTNTGGSCGDFTIQVNISFVDIKAPVIAGSQTVCSTVKPSAFTVSTPAVSSGTITYQWQKSTTSCTTGFSDIAGATSSTYDPPTTLSQTTYYRLISSSAAGCSPATKLCSDISNCVTVTVNAVTPCGTVTVTKN
ncbi:hypothetical protein GCM10011514_37180 [Emticicia aquatilis]|uniref:Ig-like domain-containing protein n=1 Tax=Emticicia aquatilis TaxID=1537369 RepID=A0A917DUY5_9BACT|nr:hypothetical protein [Emticicia aquatilis]GGD69645.1 hypothetical protein GCM10011514_37180 [Emticicia aquatilis]